MSRYDVTKGPDDDPPRNRERHTDVERPVEDAESGAAEETTSANLAMNEEFLDAGAHDETPDAGIENPPGDGGPDDDADSTLDSGIIERSAD
jgi:hypothetical protein